MNFSRMHLGLVGTVSIFTGMISPVVKNTISGVPFPLTDLQIPAYFVLLSLAILCIFLAQKIWSGVRIFGSLILILLVYLFMMAWGGEVRTSMGILVPTLSWGWVFLTIGSGLILGCIFSDKETADTVPTLSDHILGWLGAITILALTGLIIVISYVPRTEQANKNHILGNIFGTGNIETHSGVTKSNAFASIEKMTFDRKKDAISFFTSSGTNMIYIPENIVFNRLPYAVANIGNTKYIVNAEGLVNTMSGTLIGKAILPQEMVHNIIMYSGGILQSLDINGIHTYPHTYPNIENITKTKEGIHTAWKTKTESGYILYLDGNPVGDTFYEIDKISLSSDGSSVMALIKEANGSGYIMKNGIKTETINTGFIEGTLRMNGTESIYVIEKEGTVEIVYNGAILDRKFDEIREIYLDIDGSGYTYFGRPLGEKTYCLYTRYRGNLCGFSGYMNPRQSPDSSIIYAGLKDGIWGIYRNTGTVIRNTGYPNRDNISRDYVFFDITNPSYYLFIRGDTDGYQFYTKGAWIHGIWKDIGLDVTFGYDNKVIMSAQDDSGWHIIEF